MKKNILLVPSLLALSFVATTPLLGMEYKKKSPTSQGKNRKQRRQQEKNQQKKQRQVQQKQISEEKKEQQKEQSKNNFQSVMQDLQSSKLFLQQSQLNNVAEVIENPLYNPEAHIQSNLILSETEVITLALPEHATNNNNNNTNDNQIDLSQSVILPTAAKELTWLEKLSYHTSTANQILQQVISNLELGQFDTTDKRSFDLLEEAIMTATKNNDIAALAKISAACQQKYSTTIRISTPTAQTASQALDSHYSKELILTNDKLQNKHEEKIKEWNMATATCMTSIINAINLYKQDIGVIYGNYDAVLDQETKHITNLSRDLNKFSSLNRDIRPGTMEFLTHNQLKTPKNIHTTTMSISENKFSSILKTVETEIPTIQGLQKNPVYIQNLTNKCLTNK
jgi:hypothetical protein